MTLLELLARITEFFQEKKNPILASIIICFVTLEMHYYSNEDKLTERRKDAVAEVMNAFEDVKNNLSDGLKGIYEGHSLNFDERKFRIEKLFSLVKVVMRDREYLPSDSLYDLAKYTRFIDSQDMKKLSKLQAQEIQSRLDELQASIRDGLKVQN